MDENACKLQEDKKSGQTRNESDTLKDSETYSKANDSQTTHCRNETLPDDGSETKQTAIARIDTVETLAELEGDKCEHRCGFLSFSPDWLQPFTSKKSFTLFYGVLGMAQFALSTYFIATISTIEKRFKMPTRTSGIITSSADLGYMAVLFCSYFGRIGDKPLWIASGAMLCAFSSFGKFLPHLLYGPGSDAIDLASSGFTPSGYNGSKNFEPDIGKALCGKLGPLSEHCEDNVQSIIVALIFIASQIVNGLGCSTYWSLGFTYMDDNVRKDKVALLIAICSFMRSFGPMIGFFVSWIALDMYIDPSLSPSIERSDPRWMGAWWYGWAPLGSLMVLFGIAIALFPSILPRAAARKKILERSVIQVQNDRDFNMAEAGPLVSKDALQKENLKKENLDYDLTMKGFILNIRRLLRNKLFVLNVTANLFYMFGMMGYWSYLPKYMETQFHVSASEANIVSGAVGLVFSGIGLLASGAAITVFKPPARFLAGWNTGVEVLDAVGHYMYALVGCPKGALNFHGSMTEDFAWNLTDACNVGCSCSNSIKYDPVCQQSKNLTFYSPCHAGCQYIEYNGSSKIYMDCSCADNGPVVPGFCPVDCYEQFMIFVMLMSFLRLVSSTSRSSSSIIMIRCVSPVDKSLSIGMLEMGLILFAFLPAPIIYGLILDNVCLIWGETCGETGNCWLYDAERMRYYLNFTSSTFLVLAAIADFGVFLLAKDLKIYDDDIEEALSEKEKKKDPEDGLEFDEMSKEAQLLILRAVQSPVTIKKSDIAPEE